MLLGHTSIQVQQWPVNAPLLASRAGIIKNLCGLQTVAEQGRGGEIPCQRSLYFPHRRAAFPV